MTVIPGDYIKELLVTHKSVSLPKVGGFLTQSRAAQLDEGLGRLTPPSKKVIFTPNLAIDDGLLVKYMVDNFDFTFEKATDTLISYCVDVNHALDNKEFFPIKGIGRIYKDFDGKIKFLPDHSNLNEDSFGLPDLDFSPIAQESTAVKTALLVDEKPIAASSTPIAPILSKDSWWQKNGKLVAAITALILILWVGNSILKKDANAEKLAINSPGNRTNISPSPVQNTKVDEFEAEQDFEEELDLSDEELISDIDTEQPTLAPSQKVAVIAIGKFGSKENIKNLVQRIFDEGFDPYQEKLGKLTRVGVQFTYQDEAEVHKTLAQVKKIFEPDAEILRK